MESAPFKAFAASLRLDYKCPSAHVLQNRLTQSVYQEVEEAIKLDIAKSEMVTLTCFAHQDPGFWPLRRLACVAGLLPFERPSALFRGGHLFDG